MTYLEYTLKEAQEHGMLLASVEITVDALRVSEAMGKLDPSLLPRLVRLEEVLAEVAKSMAERRELYRNPILAPKEEETA